ncbi:DUF1552 domain-containing protein [Chondromyces crocatus]|nr:DUF1552 domain-containing protein [Chondromyces crocatus]
MKKTSMSRRRFTFGLGASLLAAPILGLLSGTTRADTSKLSKRLVLFFSPNGTIHKHWRPTGSGTNFSFPAGSILEPLTAHKSKLVVCDGIDFHATDNHEPGMAAMLTGNGDAGSASGGMSIDQYVAGRIGQESRFPSLEFGVQTSAWGGSNQTRMSYLGPGQFVPPEDSPTGSFQRMFGDLIGDPEDIERAIARKKSVFDLVGGELKDLQRRVGKVEKDKLEEHLTAVRKLEAGLTGGAGSCTAPVAPMQLSPHVNDNFPEIGKAQMDLLVMALACDMTRVASIQWSHTVGPVVPSWLGISEGHHSLSHMDDGNVSGVQQFVQAERWFAEQFAYLIESLAATPDPEGGTLLDTTTLVWCKELGDPRMHDCRSVPMIIAGGKYFPLGRYMNFGGAPHQQFLVSLCHSVGLDNQTFGDASKGTGPLPGLA